MRTRKQNQAAYLYTVRLFSQWCSSTMPNKRWPIQIQ